ncbi:MAG: sigma-54-dependent Fis family transcriptional regulator [Bacteroidales bacterium]|nr:sigma-54-dependent Fis family transcriptional regulator [Bacteroidales bacterium]MBN2820792.1 sigma-54-dependent Fis family transcriptional regulator [Bacteroidales bacterium]
MKKGKILVIDDEDQLRKALSRIIELEGYEVFQAETATKGLKIFEKENDFSLVICDVKLPDINGLEVLKKIKFSNTITEVILITAYGTIHDGVFAMKQGAFDYITKGDGDEQILVTVEKAIEKSLMQKRILELENKLETRYSFDRIIGKSQIIKNTINLAEKVAPTDSTVLLEGETGTGKELFAQSIHNASPRKNKPFIAVNCSAFPKELLESEIFGHKKGAFTGATLDKKGLFEEANDGTLFLDEIGEMHPDLQSKLLRVLEEQTFTKIGDTRPIKVNVRIIAATNRILLEEILSENFRSDLYYRLSVFKIQIPALRDRKEDIPLLVKNFISIYASKTNKKIDKITPEFYDKLSDFNWPGNTRELKNMIERAVILSENNEITKEALPLEVLYPDVNTLSDNYGTLEEMEKIHIQKILRFTKGNKTKTAEKLGIGVPTLYRKLEKYGLK